MFTKRCLCFDLVQLTGFLLILTACATSPVETNAAPPVPSSTITPSATFAPTNTPTEHPTSAPIPTATSTPQPEWVTTFAQPILEAIANRPPDFQDDFHDQSGGWQADDWCGNRIEIKDGELIITNCRARRADIDYSDFVLEVDGRILPGAGNDTYWLLAFRELNGPAHQIVIGYDGYVNINLWESPSLNFEGMAHSGNQSNHILIIAKGWRFAFYVNHQPLYSTENSHIRIGSSRIFVESQNKASGAFDNFKIWDISDLP